MKKVTAVLAMLGVLICAAAVRAELNHDPALPAPAPVLDLGWAYDEVTALNTNSTDSPYIVALANPAYFRITDAFLLGDNYVVYNFGNPILTTALNTPPVRTPFGDDAVADTAWVSALHQHGEIVLAPGNYQLTVQGDGAGGLSAGFYTRLDTVPEPGTFVLAGMGLVGLAVVGWKRRK